jgi:hypothetical protein
MRLFNRTRMPPSAEDAAAMQRLDAIMGRGQAELTSYVSFDESVKVDRVQRRFWTPEELAAETNGE